MISDRQARLFGLGLGLMCGLSTPTFAEPAPPEMILRNGHIFTGDAARPWVEALAIRNGRVLLTGANGEIGKTARAKTVVIDLGGRMAMAGVNDAHDHPGDAPFGVTAATKRPPQADPPIGEVAAAIREVAATAPTGAWIEASVGASVMREAKDSQAAIDDAGLGHPVILTAWWGHGLLANTAALKALKIDEAAVDPPGGSLDRDKAGHLTGRLDEYAGTAILQRLTSGVSLAERVVNMRQYADRRLREGVTSVQGMATDQRLDVFSQTLVAAQPAIRLRIIRFPIPAEDARFPGQKGLIDRRVTPLVRVSGVKYVLDGSPIEQLAFQSRDYPGRPGWRGRPNFDADFLDARLKEALTGKEQLALHVVGDAMAVQVLDAMERLAPPERWRPLRVRLEHANGIVGPQIERARRMGIVIAQPRPTAPLAAWLAAGLPVAYGSDMAFGPWSTFQRMTAPDNPQHVTREQALGVLTSGPAFAEFSEGEKGRLTPGMYADVAVLSQDVTRAPTDQLPSTHSLLTLVGGRVAYAAPEFSSLK